jgi:hypothetical protein
MSSMIGSPRFNTNAVVYSSTNSLFAPEITLGSLEGNVTEKKLNLLQLSSCRMTELRAGASQVMRSETSKANFRGIQLDHVPHQALCNAVTPALSSSADASK